MWDVAEKRCVITGAGRGIGRQVALKLAERGGRVVVAGRDNASSEAILYDLEASGFGRSFVELDLSSLASVRSAGDQLANGGPIGIFVANAGVAGPGHLTADGFERSFGINHLGHFGLAQLVREQLSGGRMVVVSSNAHYDARSAPTTAVRKRVRGVGFEAYRRSKLANVLFVREASRRWPDVVSVAVHPGVVATDIWNRVPQPLRWWMTRSMASPEEGGRQVVDAALADDVRSGSYLVRGKDRAPSEMAVDDELAAELWEASMELFGDN